MAELGSDIQKAAALLRAGELVAIPTETVYGLAANAMDQSALVKIFSVKNRPAFDPLIVHVSETAAFTHYAEDIPSIALSLASEVCPGPVTFIFRKKPVVPDLVTSGHATVGLRVPDHALTLELLKSLPFPLAAPSANPFGFVSPTCAMDVQEQLGEAIPYILDGGPCRIGLESTIIDFSGSDPQILRLGGLSLEFIEDRLQRPVRVRTSSSSPRAPGMLSSHYNPGKKVLVGNITELVEKLAGQKVGVLAFRQAIPGLPTDNQRILSLSGDLQEAARNFFRMLREFRTLPVDLVLAEKLPEVGLGRAINDRLRRAAADTDTRPQAGLSPGE